MEDLLTYSKYEQVICFSLDRHYELVIRASTNRSNKLVELISFVPNVYGTEKSFGSIMQDFFKGYGKKVGHQTNKEGQMLTAELAEMHTRQIRQELLQDERVVFHQCQFLFCLPFGWDGEPYESAVRALFTKTGWISQEDPKNRLIFSPFIERLIQTLNDDYSRLVCRSITFSREKKYLLLSIDDDNIVRLITFQMQSAKELIAISKKLAASDYLLVPTILGNTLSLDLKVIDTIQRRKLTTLIVKHIIYTLRGKTYHRNKNKSGFPFRSTRHLVQRRQRRATTPKRKARTSSRNRISQCTKFMIDHFTSIWYLAEQHMLLGEFLGKNHLYGLENWTCGAFVHEISEDVGIKELIKQALDVFQSVFEKYGSLKGSPDGLQNVILHCSYNSDLFKKIMIRNELKMTNLLDDNNELIQVDFNNVVYLCEAAMQKPLKMLQIANAILPPTIWNQDDSNRQVEVMNNNNNNSSETDLLPPNAFYVQAYINDDHIYFILNKVVAVPSTNNTAHKATFTVQEKSVALQDITDIICENIWGCLMMTNYNGNELQPAHYCKQHSSEDCCPNISYQGFKKTIQKMMNLLQDTDDKYTPGIDGFQSVSANNNCSSGAFNISYRMLIDVGIHPAVSHIAAVIASTLASASFFGLYSISALIIMDDFKKIDIEEYKGVLRKALRDRLTAHDRKPVILLGQDELMNCKLLVGGWATSNHQILGTGAYSQISGCSYMMRICPRDSPFNDILWEYDQKSFKRRAFLDTPDQFVVLKQGQYLGYDGITTGYYCNYCEKRFSYEFYILNELKGKIYPVYLWTFKVDDDYNRVPFIVKFIPQNHASTLRLEISHIDAFNEDEPKLQVEFVDIQERLTLIRHTSPC